MANKEYLGQGLKHPYEVNQFGRIQLTKDNDLVKQSLELLFNTPVGSELYRESFGTQHRQAMFEPNDSIARSLLDYFIVDAISKFERRVRIADVIYNSADDQSDGLINVEIQYILKQSNEIDSFIFPFYRELKN